MHYEKLLKLFLVSVLLASQICLADTDKGSKSETFCKLKVKNSLKTKDLSVTGDATICGDLCVKGNFTCNTPPATCGYHELVFSSASVYREDGSTTSTQIIASCASVILFGSLVGVDGESFMLNLVVPADYDDTKCIEVDFHYVSRFFSPASSAVTARSIVTAYVQDSSCVIPVAANGPQCFNYISPAAAGQLAFATHSVSFPAGALGPRKFVAINFGPETSTGNCSPIANLFLTAVSIRVPRTCESDTTCLPLVTCPSQNCEI